MTLTDAEIPNLQPRVSDWQIIEMDQDCARQVSDLQVACLIFVHS
jgi:hypothetical protein